MDVVERPSTVGASGLDGGVALRVMVVLAEFGLPTAYPVPVFTVTVRLPLLLLLLWLVGMEIVSESDEVKVRVSPVADP